MDSPPQNEFRQPPQPLPPRNLRLSLGAMSFVALMVAVPTVLATAWLAQWTGRYGYALFVCLPMVAGFLSGLIVNWSRPWSWWNSIITLSLTALFVVLGMVVGGMEGVICILMAMGLLWILICGGLFVAWLVRGIAKSSRGRRNLLLVAICSVPLCSAVELQIPWKLELIEQTTSIEIDAPPAVVWPFVPAFPDISTPPSWLFRNGIAYPLRSEIEGSGLGSKRRCVLSTGVMEETVTSWEPAQRLEFQVLTVPPAMTEKSLYDHVETLHLNGYFVPQRGRFTLTPLPNGHTLLEGTSWYSHEIWPKAYWSPITKWIVHGIHQRVLEHIKALAETR